MPLPLDCPYYAEKWQKPTLPSAHTPAIQARQHTLLGKREHLTSCRLEERTAAIDEVLGSRAAPRGSVGLQKP